MTKRFVAGFTVEFQYIFQKKGIFRESSEERMTLKHEIKLKDEEL